jgi:hypothetical protein
LPFELQYTLEAKQQYDALSKAKDLVAQFRAVRKALRLLQDNPAHPSLNTHKYDSLVGPENAEVFEAYAQNKTPGAYRIFWCYYPRRKEEKAQKGKHGQATAKKSEKPATITVVAITPHP